MKKSKSATEASLSKRSKRSSRKKKKKKKNEEEKRKKTECSSGDSSSDDSSASKDKQRRKRTKSRHKNKKTAKTRGRHQGSSSDDSNDEVERDRRTQRRKKRKQDSHKDSDSGPNSKKSRKNGKAAEDLSLQGCYVLYLLDINKLVLSALSVGARFSDTSSTSAVAGSTLYYRQHDERSRGYFRRLHCSPQTVLSSIHSVLLNVTLLLASGDDSMLSWLVDLCHLVLALRGSFGSNPMLARAAFLSLSLGASLVPALGPMRHRDMVEPVRLLSVCVSSDGGPEHCASRLVLLFIFSTLRDGSSTSRMAVVAAGSSFFSLSTLSTSAMHSLGA
ncbi:hypothetical protein FQN60_004912 [Etheostoma spectabile]|uniref:Uncharacterized protein n=1 Tax=Etheostoma spectabile TaxID=54343 RepID=A0A5J5DLH9_9PERO|nr:hypothetical protein FQN60_004912 [Etheostoma spectabile]